MKIFPATIIAFLGSLLLTSQVLWAQTPIDVKANDFVTTTIFFPSNIKKVVAPAANYQFTYEQNTNIGLLKGRNGKASNLLVITEQGYIYSFALSYAEEVAEFNFILSTDQAISRTQTKDSGDATRSESTNLPKSDTETKNTNQERAIASKETEEAPSPLVTQTTNDESAGQDENKVVKPVKPVENKAIVNQEADLYDVDREEYYRIFCENNYLQKTLFKRSFRQNKKIAIRLNNILVDRNEKYFVLQIENNSKREYGVAGLSFFRKSSVGQLEKIMNPLYSFNLQENIDPDSINEVVYVFKNFTIGSKEKIVVALADADSKNMVLLPLDDILINSPSN